MTVCCATPGGVLRNAWRCCCGVTGASCGWAGRGGQGAPEAPVAHIQRAQRLLVGAPRSAAGAGLSERATNVSGKGMRAQRRAAGKTRCEAGALVSERPASWAHLSVGGKLQAAGWLCLLFRE